MSRRMSCSMTIDAVRDRTKTVTRRHVDTWKDLKPGDRLTLIEKGMGLPKGARQVVLAEVEIVSAYVTPLATIHAEHDGPAKEGLPDMTTHQFIAFWCEGHGYRHATDAMEVPCRRIEWRYLDAGQITYRSTGRGAYDVVQSRAEGPAVVLAMVQFSEGVRGRYHALEAFAASLRETSRDVQP